ncbi:hypothetical protein GWO43_25910 [candidate division KSB1 bacterium]|nr:hypothetical protein [candidate division KSB1 bacterium]NIR69249.1 hypothetical protein [candidate division KSB1 bacterium]NIS27423.1 hypothetical protein [candidate division KSB1 bacterium]NIT74248.1 hypothetical protein [candidate division KSB1 bacterium]NIU28140.1 hypothetical protein [candidate division KSB1 bacterium]
MVSLEFTPYADRRIDFLEVRRINDSQLKIYSIVYGNAPLDRELFEKGLVRAAESIPDGDPSAGRPGLGFAVLHQGKTGNYVVLCWWDNENELPTRLFLSDDQNWRPARENESFCVWDLQVMWFERCAYIETVLSGENRDTVEDYLTSVLH